jgi:sulfite exporter TauE/SafE
LLWGWLPCGLIYSSLIWASSSASWQQSGLLMFAFGIGTLPANLATGVLAEQLKVLLRKRLNQRLMGLVMVCLGLYTLPLWH